jgi:hypothetical protein
MKNVVFWDIRTQFVLHRRHITSPLQIPASLCYVRFVVFTAVTMNNVVFWSSYLPGDSTGTTELERSHNARGCKRLQPISTSKDSAVTVPHRAQSTEHRSQITDHSSTQLWILSFPLSPPANLRLTSHFLTIFKLQSQDYTHIALYELLYAVPSYRTDQ